LSKSVDKNKEIFSYISGFSTAILISFTFVLFIGYKIGFRKLGDEFIEVLKINRGEYGKSYKDILYLPSEIIDELKVLNAPIENARNVIPVDKNKKLLTKPDSTLDFVLKKNVKLDVHLLDFINNPNLDPPVIHYNNGDVLSENLINYLKNQTLLQYQYSTDENGFRTTLPNVDANNKILVIGDSVTFGVGVDDTNTVVSKLQQIYGSSIKFINAGVGNYTGHQAVKRASIESENDKYKSIIYIACQNDFKSVIDAEKTLEALNDISSRFNKNVLVVLHTYMEYNLQKFLSFAKNSYWIKTGIPLANDLRNIFPDLCKKYDFNFLDWSNIVEEYKTRNKSVFSPFNLYADHCHLSPKGNSLMANYIAKKL
tara:strand:- start:4063 stop:5172 length:1110 start_codon:yes stop_codon:yes gene_type:complete